MRSEASEVGTQGGRKRFLPGTRREATRRLSLRRVALEALELESRTLLSNLPTPQVTGPPIDISNTGGNQSAPSIAIDPNNSLKMAAVWTRFDTNLQNTQVRVEMSYSVDGGNTWSSPNFVGGVLTNPVSANPTAPFAQVTDAHVAFDRNDNFYVLDSQHTADNTSGALALSKYNLTSGSLATVFTNHVAYEWATQDQANTPMLAVDNNVASFSDVDVNGATQNQSDPFSGNVYVAWATNDTAPKNFGNGFNPNRIVIEASSDGGQTFSGYQVVNNQGNFGSDRNTNPQLVVSQGAAPRKAGTNGPSDPGSPGIAPGQVTVAWDDFGTFSNANPPLDAIMASPVTGGISADFQGTGGPIVDATNPGNNAANIPGVTDFTIPVNITNTNFKSLSDLAVTVNITHPADNELSIVLIPPTGSNLQPITLVFNQTNAGGGATGLGVGGVNFGTTASGVQIGTTFSDNATRAITDGNSAAPFDGYYLPSGGSLQATYGGATPAQLNGKWTLEITDFRAGNVGTLSNWSLHFVSGLTAGANSQVTTTTVRGNLTEASTGLGTNITPLGITPQISLAEDNTLGAYSPYQGRIYLAYVDRSTIQGNQADNTDILLISSDDGGQTWQAPSGFNNTPGFAFNAGQVVNNDNGATDGFSESDPGFNGRPQFEPQVAVDQSTGSVVLSWLDTRNDAARVRTATYVTASNDGGQSFSSQVYLNPSQTAVDAITGQTVNLGPIPDNATGSAVGADSKTFGFGRYEGLAVSGGVIHAVWSSDLNGGTSDGKTPLNIRTGTATIPAGPRVISSTMGPVGLPGDTINSDTTADGTPIVSAFQVTFDRPVDPNTFGPNQVQVFYHDTTTTNVSGEQVPVQSVNAINSGPFGATTFQVNFAPRSGVGTYSYTIGPNISDRIRSTNLVIAPTSGPQPFNSADTPVSSQFGGVITSTIPVTGFAANQVVSNITVNLTVTDPFDPGVTITLIAPDGTNIPLASFEGNAGSSFANFTNTTFSDGAPKSIQTGSAPFSNSYRPETPLARLKGHMLNGNWRLQVIDFFGDPVQISNWTLNLTPGVVSTLTSSGNPMDQNANGVAGEPAANGVGLGDVYAAPTPTSTGTAFVSKAGQFFPGPYDPNTLPLIISGPHVVSTTIPGNPVANGTTVVNGPVSSIEVTFDRNMNPASFTLAQVLGIQGPLGAITPTSITRDPNGTDPNPSFPRTYQINFPVQVYSGTYTVQLASTITSENGDELDTNLNAGVDVLRDTPSTNVTGPVVYPSVNVPVTLAPGATATSTLQVPDNFTIQGLQVALNISEANDPDLTATLVGPDGTSITLFSNVGATGSHANFNQTVFDDSATTPIQNGGPPFTGRFIPQQPLGTFVGKASAGAWKLVISSNNPQGLAGTLNSWSITFTQKTVTYPSSNASQALPVGKTVTSTLVVPDSFTVQDPTLTLDITEPYDPGLTATLTGPDGTMITLFSSKNQVGNSGTKANFTQTTFDDNGTTLITAGSPPFTGRYVPQQPLSTFTGKNAAGVWTLTLTTDSTTSDPNAKAGELNSWSLSFQKVAPISGLGEPVADQFSTSFRIFQMSPTNQVSSTSWTAVGPVSIGSVAGSAVQSNGYAGRATAIAVDPSDPSGNTVYIGAASGGVWKTTDFLTTDPAGPTWIPLTDFGPTLGMNIGSIAVFPRNNDPNQSVIFAGTGEANANFTSTAGNTNQGVGVLRSMDGGKTWQLLDSTDNTLPFSVPTGAPPTTPVRDHIFAANGGTSTYKIVVDPNPTPTGGVIVYAALGSGTATNPLVPNTTGGLWRSTDSGLHWQKMSNASLGDATDVVLDLNSATVDQVSNPTGNVNIIYAAFANNGVYISPNRGQTLNPINGNNFDPLIRDPSIAPPKAITLTNGGQVSLAGARVTLAKPALIPANQPEADVKNLLFEGWIYAAVTNNGHLTGLFQTKDYGQTWTQLKIPTFPSQLDSLAEPSNDPTRPNYDPVGSQADPNASYHVALTVDPSDPNIVYVGGTSDGQQSGLIRIDATGVYDSHALVGYDNSRPDGGLAEINTTGRATVKRIQDGPPELENNQFFITTPTQYINLIQDPQNPFQTNATLYVFNTSAFTNDGSGVKWIPFDQLLNANATDTAPSTGLHQLLAMTDPLTGKTRLIAADDQGIFTGVDNGDGTLDPGIGTLASATFSRNGDLQIAEELSGASQPSTAAAQVAKALYYGNGVSTGESNSDPNILTNGNLNGGSIPISGLGGNTGDLFGTGVATDQQGNGIVYQYAWPGFGGTFTNFFQVSVNGGPFISRTSELIQANVGNIDPQWPIAIPNYPDGVRPGNFAVNPVDGQQVIISSNAGRIFSTINEGVSWQVIGNPGDLDSSYADALAFGAPDPAGPNGIGNLNDFLYAGTINGNIFVTQTGGGATGNAWTNISTGLDGSAVMQIITNPTRGSHEAYAVTQKGVYHIADSVKLANAIQAGAPAATLASLGWQPITNNLFTLTTAPFGNASEASGQLLYLTSIVADWRYAIPADPTKPANPTTNPTHPVLYVGGEGGVYRSLDGGATWSIYPSMAFDGAPVNGGLLPNAHVTSLTTSLGNIDQTTGRAVAQTGDPNTLLASSFGRGEYAIRLAPIVFPSSVQLDPNLPAPNGSTNGSTAPDGTPLVTIARPVIDGFSEQSAFGNVVHITLYDLTNPSNPRIIGGYNPSDPSTNIAADETNASGQFAVQVNPGAFPTNGLKVIGIQATDASGTVGNMATLKFTLQASNLGLPQPPSAPTLALLPSDDTSNGHDITRVTTPHLIGQSDPSTPSNPVTITLIQIGGPAITVPAPVTTSSADGTFSFQLPPLADGTYTFQVTASNIYSPPSTTGQTLTFTVKTVGPQTAPTLQLSPADDSGIKGDGITDVRQPHLIGQTDPGAIVNLYSLHSVLTSTITVPAALVTGNVQSLSINLSQLNITNPQALSITLTGPDGTVVTIPSASNASSSVSISGLVGKPAAGTYVLKIVNNTPNSGTLNGWTLTLTDSNRVLQTFASTQAGVSGSLMQPLLASTVANSSGQFTIQLPNVLVNGPIELEATAQDVAGNPAPAPSPVLNLSIVTVAGDYNLGGKADPAVVQRVGPGQLQWTVQNVTPTGGLSFGAGGLDVPLSGDFDGDGKTDFALYRPSTATWYISRSTLGFETVSFGWAGVDIPVPADYTGSGVTDIALYRPTDGQWFIIGPNNNLVLQRDASGNLVLGANGQAQVPTFGGPGDIPVPGNYNGLGKAQLAVYDPTSSTFYTLNADGQTASIVQLGKAGDVPVPGEYDNSVNYHQTEYAVFDPTTATWTIDGPSGIRTVQFGAPGDIPAPGDYDGTGVTELAVYRPSNGLFFVMGPSGVVQLNVKNGIPINAPESYRQALTVGGDYNASGSADLALFQRTSPGLGQWFIQNVSPPSGINFGSGLLDIPVVGDFTGMGQSQLAIYRPSSGQWFIPSLGANGTISFGGPGDIPVPGRYLGGETTYLGVFRPSTGQWFYNGQVVQFGAAGDVPVPGNYDGTGITELSVYRPSTSQWFILGPSGGTAINIGQPGDVPVPGNYAGTGRDQPAVYRPSTSQFIIENPNGSGQTTVTVGTPGSIPAPGDYDGNGRDEPAVYNPTTGVWSILEPTGVVRTVLYGNPGAADIPVLAPYVYRSAAVAMQAPAFPGSTTTTTTTTRPPLIAEDLHVAQVNPASGSGSGGSSGSSTSTSTSTPTVVTPPSSNGRQRLVAQATRHSTSHSLHDTALDQLGELGGLRRKVRHPHL